MSADREPLSGGRSEKTPSLTANLPIRKKKQPKQPKAPITPEERRKSAARIAQLRHPRVAEMLRDGYTFSETGRKCGLSAARVSQIAKLMGVKPPLRGVALLVRDWTDQMGTIPDPELAALAGVSARSVAAARKKLNIAPYSRYPSGDEE